MDLYKIRNTGIERRREEKRNSREMDSRELESRNEDRRDVAGLKVYQIQGSASLLQSLPSRTGVIYFSWDSWPVNTRTVLFLITLTLEFSQERLGETNN